MRVGLAPPLYPESIGKRVFHTITSHLQMGIHSHKIIESIIYLFLSNCKVKAECKIIVCKCLQLGNELEVFQVKG